MSEPRLGNVITLLIPARSYKINCAWTKEKLMPGIEQFACRLLLIFDQLYPSELQSYFGLNDREREVLLDSLLANRLINVNPEGHVEARFQIISATFMEICRRGSQLLKVVRSSRQRNKQYYHELSTVDRRQKIPDFCSFGTGNFGS